MFCEQNTPQNHLIGSFLSSSRLIGLFFWRAYETAQTPSPLPIKSSQLHDVKVLFCCACCTESPDIRVSKHPVPFE